MTLPRWNFYETYLTSRGAAPPALTYPGPFVLPSFFLSLPLSPLRPSLGSSSFLHDTQYVALFLSFRLYYLPSPFSPLSLSLSSFVQVDCERGIDPPRRKARLTRPTVIPSHPDCRYPSSARPPLADHRLPNSAISKLAFVHVLSLAIVFHSLFISSFFFLFPSFRRRRIVRVWSDSYPSFSDVASFIDA